MDKSLSRTKKTVIIFVLCTLVLQGIFSMLFNTRALETMLPLYIRSVAQDVVCGDNSYTEYFTLRRSAEKVDVLYVGVDFTSPAALCMLEDLIISLKHDINIGGVIIDPYGDPIITEYASYCVDSIMPAPADFYYNEICAKYEAIPEIVDFLDCFQVLNENYPPQNKLFGCQVPESENHLAALVDTASNTVAESGRAVLVLLAETDLTPDSPLCRLAKAANQSYMCVSSVTTNGVWDASFPSRESAVYLVEREDLWLFDRLYSWAATLSSGMKQDGSFLESRYTELFFVITDSDPIDAAEEDPE